MPSLLDLMQQRNDPGTGAASPPGDPAVQNMIAQTIANWNAQNAGPGTGAGPFVGNEYFQAASQPGQSGYFQLGDSGNILPRVQTPDEVARDAGVSVNDLARNFGPTGASSETGNVDYPVPNTRGGFFRISDVFQRAGAPVPAMFSAGANLPSTNNWRLLGNNPGYLMRNGNLIDLLNAATQHGFSAYQPSGAVSAEHGGAFGTIALGTGVGQGMPNNFFNAAAGWPGSITPWRQRGSGTQY